MPARSVAASNSVLRELVDLANDPRGVIPDVFVFATCGALRHITSPESMSIAVM
jgi:hypothetical protein